MFYTITIPINDYQLIEKFLKKGTVVPELLEILERTYEIDCGGINVTAQVTKEGVVLYRAYEEDFTIDKTIRSLVCHFGELGITVAFDADKSYV